MVNITIGSSTIAVSTAGLKKIKVETANTMIVATMVKIILNLATRDNWAGITERPATPNMITMLNMTIAVAISTYTAAMASKVGVKVP